MPATAICGLRQKLFAQGPFIFALSLMDYLALMAALGLIMALLHGAQNVARAITCRAAWEEGHKFKYRTCLNALHCPMRCTKY
jgi:hypothetical protein